jgi:ABC-2 type transport system permease protein
MPVFDQGYQHWQGTLAGHAWRWLAITRQGVRAQLKNRWTRLVLGVACVPALALAAALILWGLIEQKSSLVTPLLRLFSDWPELQEGPRAFRVTIWTIAYQFFFQIQMLFSMILVLLVGPSLISQDLRFNALPLYFSRPLRRVDYFAGKLGVIAFFLGAVAVVPAVFAYLLGVGFSLDAGVVTDTFRLLLASVASGLVVVLSAGTLMLALSSLSRNSRYVGAMWVGIWFVSGAVAGVLIGTVRADWCPLVSYTANLERIERTLLDTDSAWHQIEELIENARQRAPAVPFGGPGRMAMGRRLEGPRPGRELEPPRPDGAQRPARAATALAGPNYPWYWSAGILAGLFGISLWTLTFRVKSLDRLR